MTWICEDPDVIELVRVAKLADMYSTTLPGDVRQRLRAAIWDIPIPEEEW